MAGRRIDDHSSWVGAAPKGQVFPLGAKTKSYSSSEGSGGITDYPDTSELVEKDQKSGDRQIKGQPLKSGHRY